MSAGLRHQARIAALQTLFESEFAANSPNCILIRTLQEKEIKGDTASFASELVCGVIDNKQFIDDTIKRFATAFPIEQIATMDRNILRLALFEILLHNKVPPKVAINEAVELAKQFGSEKSAKFVNGVLGSVIAEKQQRNK
ncbi:MAG: transcription antitermination factor NusB [Dehalococcoidia bacterium]|jgi:N utilization substance protein B|nr:transcription antitermination factor NusB [Dehalococcoidia bacterium]MDD5493261.1 transcription antitermination factor NusB [Dehalococcoidia bacterium]